MTLDRRPTCAQCREPLATVLSPHMPSVAIICRACFGHRAYSRRGRSIDEVMDAARYGRNDGLDSEGDEGNGQVET